MMARVCLWFLFLSIQATSADQGTCDPAEVLQLKAELAELKSKLANRKDFSVVGAATRALSLSGDVVSHLLTHTTVDEQVVDHIETAKAFAADVKKQASSVDYDGYVQQVKANIAPHIDTAATAAKPYIEEYVRPALDKASAYVDPHMEKVKATYAATSKTVQEEVLPVIQRGSSQAFDAISDTPKHVDAAHSWLGRALSPIFETCAKIAPSHAESLPTTPVDQLLFLLLGAFVSYHLFFVFIKFARWAFFLFRLKLKIVFKGGVVFPLRIVRRVASLFLLLITGFYCCGLCRRKGKAEDLKEHLKNQGVPTDAKKEVKKMPATANELTDLLTQAQKEKKLEPAAKKLATIMKSGKPMTEPKKMTGKTITKDALTNAVAKFKELDIKKLAK